MKLSRTKLLIAAVSALALQTLAPSFIETVHAANAPQFSEMFVRMDRHKALSNSGATVCAKPSTESTALTEASVTVTFPSITVPQTADGTTDFVVNATAANYTVSTTNMPQDPQGSVTTYNGNGATAWPGIGTATDVTGHSVTFPSGDLTPGTLYCFNISGTNTVKIGSGKTADNGSIAATKVLGATLITKTSTPTVINQTNWATSVIADDTITYSAVVPPNFDLKLDANTDAFTANLDPDAIGTTGGRTVTIKTNAVNGWVVWTKDSNAGLASATANYTINSSGTVDGVATGLAINTEGYGIIAGITTDATDGCTVSIDKEYDGTQPSGGTSSVNVGHLSTNFQQLAQCKRMSSLPGTSDGDVLNIKAYATIRGGTPAGSDYTDVLTIVGAGSF